MSGVRLLVADIDGTLLDEAKRLTPATVRAARQLNDAGITLALASARPPRGIDFIADELDLDQPFAAFNGGVIASRGPLGMVISETPIPEEVVDPAVGLLRRFGLDPWAYCGAGWYTGHPDDDFVESERRNVRFGPVQLPGLSGLPRRVAKLCGIGNSSDVARAAAALHREFAGHVSAAASQPFELDVTHPDANKGAAVRYLAGRLGLAAEQVAAVGDTAVDVLMFAHAGVSIAMGNASPDVQQAARHVTGPNTEDGFAEAVERFVLPPGSNEEREDA